MSEIKIINPFLKKEFISMKKTKSEKVSRKKYKKIESKRIIDDFLNEFNETNSSGKLILENACFDKNNQRYIYKVFFELNLKTVRFDKIRRFCFWNMIYSIAHGHGIIVKRTSKKFFHQEKKHYSFSMIVEEFIVI